MELTLTELLATEFLHCPGCMRGCYTPKLLECMHSFCDNCTRNGIKKPDPTSDTKIVVCPLCKTTSKLPKQVGIEGLPVNPFLNSLLKIKSYKQETEKLCDYCKFDNKEMKAENLCIECQDVMCEDCSQAHRKTKLTRGHQVVPFSDIRKHKYDHDIRGLQQLQCKLHRGFELSFFCEQCEVLICAECKGREHYKHNCSNFENALKKYHGHTKGFLGTIESKLPHIQNWINFMQSYTKSIVDGKWELLGQIEKQSKELHLQVEEHKVRQFHRVIEVCEAEESHTQLKKENWMRAAQFLAHDAELLKHLLAFGKVDELLAMQGQISRRIKQLTQLQLDGVSSKLNLQFRPPAAFNEDTMEQVFGKLNIFHLPLSQTESASLGGNSMSSSMMLPNVLTQPKLERSFDAECGLDGKEIWPSGTAVTLSGDYVVLDRDNRRVKIFDLNGQVKVNFGGLKENELGCPYDVAVLKNGNLAVTDYEKEDVKIFKHTGEFVSAIRGCFKYPRGIAVNSKGDVIVVDCHLRRLTVHNAETGKLIRTIEGKDEDGCDFFTDPYYVAVTPDDRIIVTDWAAPNIRVFSANGKHLVNYGSYGTKQDQILQPYGVCTDPYGYIFVADNQNHRVHLLLPDGKFSRHLLTKQDTIWHPMALAVDNAGHLILTEALGKVKVFKYL